MTISYQGVQSIRFTQATVTGTLSGVTMPNGANRMLLLTVTSGRQIVDVRLDPGGANKALDQVGRNYPNGVSNGTCMYQLLQDDFPGPGPYDLNVTQDFSNRLCFGVSKWSNLEQAPAVSTMNADDNAATIGQNFVTAHDESLVLSSAYHESVGSFTHYPEADQELYDLNCQFAITGAATTEIRASASMVNVSHTFSGSAGLIRMITAEFKAAPPPLPIGGGAMMTGL